MCHISTWMGDRFSALVMSLMACVSRLKSLLALFFQIIGEPSSAMMKEMGDTEKQRVVEQRKTLGEKGLAEKAKALEEATQDNEVMESFQNSNFN